MARVFIDGFESRSADLWDSYNISSIVNDIPGMDGYSVWLNAAYTFLSKDLPAADEYYVAFRYRPATTSVGNNLLYFMNGSSVLGHLRRQTSGSYYLEACRGSSTILATGSQSILANNTYLIEVRYKPHTSSGIFQVKVNGTMVIDYSGNTTDYSLQINRIRISSESATSYNHYFDNIVVDNANWPGDTRIQVLTPSGAGNSTQWTPSAGNNYECVDELPYSDSDYNSTGGANNMDLFAFSNLSGYIDSVKCVQVQARALYEGSPIPTKLQLVVRSGGSNYFSSSKDVPNTSAKSLSAIWETDPATSAAWTESGVNNAEFGYKAVTS